MHFPLTLPQSRKSNFLTVQTWQKKKEITLPAGKKLIFITEIASPSSTHINQVLQVTQAHCGQFYALLKCNPKVN